MIFGFAWIGVAFTILFLLCLIFFIQDSKLTEKFNLVKDKYTFVIGISWIFSILQGTGLFILNEQTKNPSSGWQLFLLYLILFNTIALMFLFSCAHYKERHETLLKNTIFLGIFHIGICMTLAGISTVMTQLKLTANILYVSLPAFVIFELQKKKFSMKVKTINLSNGNKRVVSGDLLEQFDLDYTQDLGNLKHDLEFTLSVFHKEQLLEKNIHIEQKQHSLKVIGNNDNLNLLVIEDRNIDP